MPEQPALVDEIKRMETEYEPLAPVEKKLILITFIAGVVLLLVLLGISHMFFGVG